MQRGLLHTNNQRAAPMGMVCEHKRRSCQRNLHSTNERRLTSAQWTSDGIRRKNERMRVSRDLAFHKVTKALRHD